MAERELTLRELRESDFDRVRAIRREDISEDFVDSADTLLELTRYGWEHGCAGRAFTVNLGGECVGVLLLGEAIPWETDPPEMRERPFYRLMGFVIDRRYRGRGLGGQALEEAVRRVYEEFGPRPIALGVHEENRAAARFYLRHGFRATDAFEGRDRYYLRGPEDGPRD